MLQLFDPHFLFHTLHYQSLDLHSELQILSSKELNIILECFQVIIILQIDILFYLYPQIIILSLNVFLFISQFLQLVNKYLHWVIWIFTFVDSLSFVVQTCWYFHVVFIIWLECSKEVLDFCCHLILWKNLEVDFVIMILSYYLADHEIPALVRDLGNLLQIVVHYLFSLGFVWLCDIRSIFGFKFFNLVAKVLLDLLYNSSFGQFEAFGQFDQTLLYLLQLLCRFFCDFEVSGIILVLLSLILVQLLSHFLELALCLLQFGKEFHVFHFKLVDLITFWIVAALLHLESFRLLLILDLLLH